MCSKPDVGADLDGLDAVALIANRNGVVGESMIVIANHATGGNQGIGPDDHALQCHDLRSAPHESVAADYDRALPRVDEHAPLEGGPVLDRDRPAASDAQFGARPDVHALAEPNAGFDDGQDGP